MAPRPIYLENTSALNYSFIDLLLDIPSLSLIIKPCPSYPLLLTLVLKTATLA